MDDKDFLNALFLEVNDGVAMMGVASSLTSESHSRDDEPCDAGR